MTTTPSSAIDNWGKESEAPREPGPVEQGVEADIAAMGRIPQGRITLAAMARKLARTIDARGDDEAASALAKAVDTLRQVMNQLMAREVSDPNAYNALEEALGRPDAGSSSVSPPLRYPPDAGPANRRTGNRAAGRRPRSD